MTAAEYATWIEFYGEEPFGDVRADTRAAVVASAVVRSMAGKRANVRLIDFMPYVKAQRDREERDNPDVRARNVMLAFESNLATKVRKVRIARRA